MPSVFARILLFLSSYVPLWAIFFLLFWGKSLIIVLISALAAILGFGGMLIYLRVANRISGVPTKVVDCRSRGDEAMSYIVTYIIPFLAVAFNDWRQTVALGVFFVLLGFLYVNSGMVHINPTLSLIGFRLYEVTVEGGSTFTLLARSPVRKARMVQVITIGEGVLLEKKG